VRAAFEAGTTGPVLDQLFRRALHAGKKVRAETAIAESPASVSSAAAALAQQVFGRLEDCRVLLVGAGHVAELAARSLAARGARIVYVANRSPQRAAELASRFAGEGIAFDRAAGVLGDVDVVVSSTGSPGRVLERGDVQEALRGRKGRPLFLIDLAVPRDLDPAIHELDGCYLYDIDDLESVVATTLSGRRREAARAEAIVAEEAEDFREWLASREVVPAIASLRAWAEEIRAAELARVRGRLGLSESQEEAVDSITVQIVNKLLHPPTVRLKEAAAGADGGSYAQAVRHLFDLGEDGAK
jgi:glutamyl-tRNA reductase